MSDSPTYLPSTFMQVPFAAKPADAKAVILGLPFDCGNHPTRVGARLGPASIREQSLSLRAYDGESGVNPLTALGLVDMGDARVVADDIDASYEAIEAAMDVALSGGAVPITLGGDGSVALPQMRSLAKQHPELCVLHIDAHTDAYPLDGYNNATPFSRAADESLVDAARSFHIGMRRSHLVPGVYEHGRQLGYQLISIDELFARGIVDVFAAVRSTIGNRPVYLCFDMDIFDPSVAPGVCTPASGGITAREGFEIIHQTAGLNVVSIDINTISPPHDVGGMSAFLAASVAYEFLAMLAKGEYAAVAS